MSAKEKPKNKYLTIVREYGRIELIPLFPEEGPVCCVQCLYACHPDIVGEEGICVYCEEGE